ncbi:TonB family protein [Amphritea sp. 2_MG-2023]|uniref:energy transducer TonB n=1 Tax=Amphritea TaxID=515417 RepID=UPI001C078408|nr:MULTISPECIES: energy transducer TonB [Amphritea]MBU2965673.1 TonB family protein [Amphritea atlantica]MDO6417229.1 TonB family protein [Amphritea sp. 2_MG-2023]
MSKTVAAVSAADRLGFTLFLAVAVHAAAILGIGFAITPKAPPAQTLEITLAQFKSDKPPEEADFIAQADQQGSGQLEEKALPATREQADFQHQDIQETAALQPQTQPVNIAPQPTPAKTAAPADIAESVEKTVNNVPAQQVVVTQAKQEKKHSTIKEKHQQSAPPPPPPGSSQSLLSRSLEIASLEAQLDFQRQAYAKRPRVKRLTSAATKSHNDAVYLANWRRKIESVGNLNYPKEAQQNQLYGSLRMMVIILPNGHVKDIRILHSSGNKVLDDAAVRIVQLAAPFQRFPIEMRKDTDELEIIRTWKFEKSARIY